MSLVNGLVGLAALLFGRQLFWLFVAAAGFVLGFNLALQFLGEELTWLVTLIALVIGALGALLTMFAQRLAIGIAGFIAGGYLVLTLAGYLHPGGAEGLSTLVALAAFIVGGMLGLALVSALFEVALVILSSIIGATLLTQAAVDYFALDQMMSVIVYVGLIIVGIVVQAGLGGAHGRREAA